MTPLYIRISPINALAKYFKDRKCVNLSVYDKLLLKNYNAVWNKIRSLFKKEFDSEKRI